jgi:CO/xanthine dehydrogenase FAD-binding subunit
LLMLDARLELASVSGVRQISLNDFLVGPKKTALRDDELLMRVIIPAVDPAFTYLWYRKIGTRRANAISKLSLCAAITIDAEGMVTDFRGASGAAGPRIARNRMVEEMLVGIPVTEIEGRLPAFLDAYDGILAPQAMPEYRRSSTRRMLEHFLRTAVTRPAHGIIE